MRSVALLLLCFLQAASLCAQKRQREPLTETQQEQIAEAGIDPPGRVNLYVKFLNERADTIKGLTTRAKGSARGERLAGELQDFAALVDELGDNLDVYLDRKADIRKSLKPLNESIQRWQAILTALPGEPAFELSRKDALEATSDLGDQAKKITADLETYFDQHKDEKGQDRAEPKAATPTQH
jgi:hypothetical protein